MYPIGRPTLIEKDFPAVEDIFGLIKCKILPPRNLFHPVLPYRTNKLTFPLCRSCVETKSRECHHDDDDERALTGTWCSPEIQEAIKQGYRVLEIFSAWHYDLKEEGLFREYIDLFYKIKTESSGYPQSCTTEMEKDAYITTFLEREKIQLDKSKIMKNEGLRALAKYMLNSFCKF